eukprot:gene8947-8095_t
MAPAPWLWATSPSRRRSPSPPAKVRVLQIFAGNVYDVCATCNMTRVWHAPLDQYAAPAHPHRRRRAARAGTPRPRIDAHPAIGIRWPDLTQ